MTHQLRELYTSLEERVAQRTADLERRAIQLEASAEVARDAATIRDVEQLLDETVHLISETFGFYHAGIFLVDDARRHVVLRAASSQGGRRMLERGHQLELGRVGIVGHVAATGEARIALDVGEDAVFFENPDLPRTRSEMALPLTVRGEIVGVLDVQSTEGNAFTEDDVAVLQTMADQVAVAIENARLLEESQLALRELERLYGRRAGEAWRERVARRPAAFRYSGVSVEEAAPGSLPALETPSADGQPIVRGDNGGRELAAPIQLRGRAIGSLVLRQDAEEEPWSPEEVALIEQVTSQIALALENARLLEETQRRAARERLTSEIMGRMRETLDVESVLKTTADELYQALGLDEIVIRLVGDEKDSETTR
jgi:GAF domain-containing protein